MLVKDSLYLAIHCFSEPRAETTRVVVATRKYPSKDSRKRTQQHGAELRESEPRLRLALESGRMYAFEWNIKTDVLVRSTEYASMIRVPENGTEEKGMDFLSRLDPEDRRHYLDGLSQLTPEQDWYHTTYRTILPNGKLCWMEARGRGSFDAGGTLVRVIGIAADVTARKKSEDALRTLSASLINAQENERKRVARELHDGVSQALAVVSIQLAQAANAASEAEIKSMLDKLYERLQGVLSDIEHLSHELHPSTLKHLGLSAAIRILCEEITQSHGIEVEFTDRGAPQAPSKDTALCLYRVAQEALRNIVKHGQCVQACVELEGNHSEVRLLVSDQGIGFNTHSAKAGLGLTSMRERMRLIGGRIVISSRLGAGTRITAYAPLEPHESQAAA